MKFKFDRNFTGLPNTHSDGMTLLDVLLAIVIFVIGMLALASLQGNLTRSSIDANSRTVGTNLAEEIIEQLRAYERLESAAGADAYQDIVTHTVTENRAGVAYTVAVTVEDWYFMPDGEAVTKDTGDLPSGWDTTISNFKNVELAVSWTGNEFQIGDGTSSTGRLGSGSFNVSGIISSVPTAGSAKVASEDDGEVGTPQVDYTPGDAPDIIAVQVGDSKFKESTTPEPVVRRRDELVETWFDVITYNTALNPNIFIRREEFVSISCRCEIQSGSSAEDGRRPTIWTGAEYQEGDLTQKTFGVSATNQQSQYCDVCCRDHHDDAGSSIKYRPFNPSSSANFSGDHPHFNRNSGGQWIEAIADGDTYLEACRLVRKDGFFRVAQDFSLNESNAFPESYLTVTSDISNYSNYVRALANEELGGYDTGLTATTHPANSALTFDGNDGLNPSDVPPVGSVATSTQLQSRGIDVDSLNSALEGNLDDCFGAGTRSDCEAPDATSVYELYPFFDVQVTHLATWTENKLNDPVHISNDSIDGLPDTTSNEVLCSQPGAKCYSRGRAELAGTEIGTSTGKSTIETGNVGLISTLPVASTPTPDYSVANLHLRANEGTEPPPSDLPVISGIFNNEGGTSDPAIAAMVGSPAGVECTAPVNGTFQCILPEGFAGTPTVTISNYSKKNTDLYVCSNNAVMTLVGIPKIESIDGYNETTFAMPGVTTGGASITITKTPCP